MSDEKIKRINHKFNLFDDTCINCGVKKRKTPYTGDGFNSNFTNHFITEYSTNGLNFSSEFINCKTKSKK